VGVEMAAGHYVPLRAVPMLNQHPVSAPDALEGPHGPNVVGRGGIHRVEVVCARADRRVGYDAPARAVPMDAQGPVPGKSRVYVQPYGPDVVGRDDGQVEEHVVILPDV